MTTEPADRRRDACAGWRGSGRPSPPLHPRWGRPWSPTRTSTGREAAGALGAGPPVSGPLILAIESSCDETGIALVEGGRRIHANVVASQVALHAPTGGIVPEVAARAHLRWILPVLDEALADAGVTVADVDAVAVTHGPGLAGSLLVGINTAKTLAWVHDKPLVGVNHLEGHVYAAWLLDPGQDELPEPVFPLVALVVSGGHTFLVEMRDHLAVPPPRPDRRRCRRRGVRQGRPAAGPRLSGRTGDPARRPPPPPPTTPPSRGRGSATASTSASPA